MVRQPSGIFTFEGQRVAENPIINVMLGNDALVTELVLGTPQDLRLPGESILPPITVDGYQFKWTKLGVEHLKQIDTERGMRAPIAHGDWRAETEGAILKRFSFRVLKDADEISNAEPSLRIRERSAMLARRIVRLDIERRRRDILMASGTYPVANVLAIAGGSEWNTANGDSRADVRSMVNSIVTSTGVMPEELVVWLSLAAFEAAKDDPVFLAVRSNFTADTPDEVALARYWGVGRVWTSNPVELKDDGTVGAMYSDSALIYWPGTGSAYDTEYGDFRFGATFTWNRGVASTPYYDNTITSWSFPWTDYALPKVITPGAAALITNCAA